jgi:hypothetical protein
VNEFFERALHPVTGTRRPFYIFSAGKYAPTFASVLLPRDFHMMLYESSFCLSNDAVNSGLLLQ